MKELRAGLLCDSEFLCFLMISHHKELSKCINFLEEIDLLDIFPWSSMTSMVTSFVISL